MSDVLASGAGIGQNAIRGVMLQMLAAAVRKKGENHG